MNQIETLKWIADNGNPVGTEAESSYTQYKNDPKFRKIAMALAASESGYSGVSDEIKNDYQSYKSEINKNIADSLRAKAKSDYEKETESTYLKDVGSILAPRTMDAQTPGEKVIAGGLDILSFPGRTAAGLAAGLGTLVGSKDPEQSVQEISDVIGRKASPEGSGVFGFAEDVVKDPLLPFAFTAIPGAIVKGAEGLGKTGAWLATHPKTAAGLAAMATNLGIGAAERGVDPTREIAEPGAALAEGVFGFGLGAAGRGISNIFESLGNSEAGRAILKKITPTELKAGFDERLAKLIEQGYGPGIDIRTSGKIDPSKLGKFLSEQSGGVEGTKIERIPDWISSERRRAGKEWGDVLEKYSKDPQRDALIEVGKNPKAGIDELLAAMEKQSTSYVDPVGELDKIIKQKQAAGDVFSPKEAENFRSDLLELIPGRFGVRTDTKVPILTVEKLADLQRYLYNEGRELSPKYHKTREELATALRQILSEEQERLVGAENKKLAKQYSAMSDLENLVSKSNYFNPDRPSTFYQGIKSDAARIVPGETVRTGAKEALQSMIRRESRKEGQSPSFGGSRESNQSEVYSTTIDRLYSSGKMSDSDRRVAQRALDSLKFNPNDSAAKATLDSLIRK